MQEEISFPKFVQSTLDNHIKQKLIIKILNLDKKYLLYFDGGIPDYRLTGKLEWTVFC
jgi:hypothetical protein